MADTAVAAEAPAPATPAKKPKASAAAAKKPKAKPTHPKTSEMVNNAIKELKERSGSSLKAIKKYIAAEYKVDSEKLAPFIRKYLKSAVESGILIQTKGTGASGSFKLESKSSKSAAGKKASAAAGGGAKTKESAAASSPAKSKKAAPASRAIAAKRKKASAAASPSKSKASSAKATPKDKRAAAAAKRKPVLRDSGTEFPLRAEPGLEHGGLQVVRSHSVDRSRSPESSIEEQELRHDEKRQKVLPISPPLITTPRASRIPTRVGASSVASAMVRLPQPASPSPSSSPERYLALPGSSGQSHHQVSDGSSEEESEGDSDTGSVRAIDLESPPPNLSLGSPPKPSPRTAVAYAAHLAPSTIPPHLRPRSPLLEQAPAAPLTLPKPLAGSRPYSAAAATPAPSPHPAASQPDDAAAAPQAATTAKGYPPIVVECLPNWTAHFAAIRVKLGHAPNARPLGKGVRFIPRSPEEYRIVQRHLVDAMADDPAISWFCYSVQADLPTKVAIRGLPADTDPEEIGTALRELDFPVRFIKHIPARLGRAGCLFHAQLDHMPLVELSRLYQVNELLSMPGVTIEHWRGAANRVPQCHRCQAFGHASAKCHRPQRCVRCGGQHFAADCPREVSAKPTCANCGRDHTANDRRCPVFRSEARKRGIKFPPPLPPAPAPGGTARQREASPPLTKRAEPAPSSTAYVEAASSSARPPGRFAALLRAPAGVSPADQPTANPPTDRGQAVPGRRKRRRGRRRGKPVASSTLSHPPPPPQSASTAHPGTFPTPAYPPPATRLAPAPPYQLPTPATVVGGASECLIQSPYPSDRPTLIPSVLRATAAPWAPLPQRERPVRPRAAPTTSSPQPPIQETPSGASASETHTTERVRSPLENILGALTKFLIITATGGNLQEAAASALATLGESQ